MMSSSQTKTDSVVFDPTQFLKARRPEQFSDSQGQDDVAIPQDQLEYYLETLTSRKEETVFESFCRALAQKELCPNLLPQTGPTGGGDSKVDTETYPVSESIASLWYVGYPERASKERWAFAFSAKKEWLPKVKSDVRKIVGTNRCYKLIYFITNQYVPDKKRSTVEEQLEKLHGVELRILDRTWIIDAIRKNGRWSIVYDILNIGEKRLKQVLGPMDTEREQTLEILESGLNDEGCIKGPQYIEDCLHTALLARGLAKPRVEVEGRFDRAERECLKYGTHLQRFRILYQRAWTSYFWYKDFGEFTRVYDQAKDLVLSSESVWVLDRLVNLCQVGLSHATNAGDEQLNSEWRKRCKEVRKALQQRAGKTDKSASALWAKTQIVFLDLVLGESEEPARTNAFNALRGILQTAKNHLDYPVEPIEQIVTEIGQYVVDDPAFDKLFELLTEIQTKRVGETKQGQIRLKRGFQLLEAGKRYETIDQMAKAQTLLAKEEEHYDFVASLAGTGVAYKNAGLLWASRANLVVAVQRAIHPYLKSGDMPPLQCLSLIEELIWMEFRLGRVPCALNWIELYNAFGFERKQADISRSPEFLMDGVLGILALKTAHADLACIRKLPALLSSMGLFVSQALLLYRLGHDHALVENLGINNRELDDFIIGCLTQPAAEELPSKPLWGNDLGQSLQSSILGCHIDLVAEDGPAVLVGETFLGYAEAFLSTSLCLSGCLSARDVLAIKVRSGTAYEVNIAEDECGETSIDVVFPFESSYAFAHDQAFKDFLFDVLVKLMAEMHMGVSENNLQRLFKEHEAHKRAFWSGTSLAATTSILGDKPKYAIADHVESIDASQETTVERVPDWKLPALSEPAPVERAGRAFHVVEEPPESMTNVELMTHKDVRVVSVINMPLWDKARWDGIAFCLSAEDESMMRVILTYKNGDSGTKIFRGWCKRIAEHEPDDFISMTIVTGIDRKEPFSYRVIISPSEALLGRLEGKVGQVFVASRMLDMNPTSDENLSRFIEKYKKAGWYDLLPGRREDDWFEEDAALSIRKRQLQIVEAWQIKATDPLCTCLGGITDPVIPSEVIAAPIIDALKIYGIHMDRSKRRQKGRL
jgi:hypothetical protein